MTWKKERDLLISQTMAYVQSVANKTTDTDRKFETRLPPVASVQHLTAERPADSLPTRLTPIGHGSSLRDEIGRRVAAFRDRQQVFHRDRDAYCNAMMEKVRAATEQARRDRDDPPRKLR
jgi:hypothetical protein